MVQWKGEIEREKCGEKAARLDEADDLNVPNFFVITKKEIQGIIGEKNSSREILNSEFSEELSKELREAYKEVDMSSAVRNASGQARNLVGGQRSGSRVSVRTSNGGITEYKLNVGESDLEGAVKEVVASYVEENGQAPAVIVQRMIEPEASGAVVLNYTEEHALVEAVKGLGTSIEEGVTIPEFYLIDESVDERRLPDSQMEDSLNPMTGEIKRRKTDRNHFIFSESELTSFVDRLKAEGYSGKFAYKRGTFYVTDLFEKSDGSAPPDLDGISVTERKVQNTGFQRSEETLPPEQYQDSLIAEKGGYTSTDAEKARRQDQGAVFSFKGEIEEQPERESPEEFEPATETRDSMDDLQDLKSEASRTENSVMSVAATKSLPLNTEGGLSLSPPFRGRYAVTSREVRGRSIDPNSYVSSCEQVFKHESDELVLDTRNIDPEAAVAAIEYNKTEFKFLIVERPHPELIEEAVRQGFDGIASNDPERVKKEILRQEKKMLLDHVREEAE